MADDNVASERESMEGKGGKVGGRKGDKGGWKERKKRGKILRGRGRVGLWCWASAALAPEKGGHHEVGGPPGPAPQPDICTTTRQMRFEGNDEKKERKAA